MYSGCIVEDHYTLFKLLYVNQLCELVYSWANFSNFCRKLQ